MNLIKARPIGIMMDRLPDNCIYDCPFCIEKGVYDQDLPYCIVTGEFVHSCYEHTHEGCPLVEADDHEEGVESDS